MTRYPDRRPLPDRPPHWPTTFLVTAYLLACAAGAYGLWLLITRIASAVSKILK